MHAFIGTVPFTIIEAVNYVISNEIEDADLYLVKVFAGAEEVGNRLKQTNVFRNVYIVEDVLLTYPITLEKCLSTVKNGKNIVNLLKDRKYDYCYYNNSGWLINSIFYTGFYKGNPQIKNVFLEHGAYSYVNDYGKKPWYLRGLINICGLKCMDGSMIEKICMFNPELMSVRHDGYIEKMPSIDKSNEHLLSVLNTAFNYDLNNNEYKDKKIIIIEQGPMKVNFNKEKIWEQIFNLLDCQDVIVKAHPRQKQSTLEKYGAAISKNHTLPWELEIINNDIADKVQIAIFSGACVSPKLLFNDEPTVILLYKLIGVDYSFLGEKIIEFVNSVGMTYKNKEKFFVPETFEELRQYMSKMNY